MGWLGGWLGSPVLGPWQLGPCRFSNFPYIQSDKRFISVAGHHIFNLQVLRSLCAILSISLLDGGKETVSNRTI